MRAATPQARAVVLEALDELPVTTSVVYDRIGYPGLLRAGLIDYRSFRAVLELLEKEGLIVSDVEDEDQGRRWRRVTG